MRKFRAVLAALIAALLVGGVLATSATAGSLPKRIIDEVPPGTKQVSYNAFKLKGTVMEPQVDGTPAALRQPEGEDPEEEVRHLQVEDGQEDQDRRRRCLQDQIYAPEKGRWKWRSKVDHSNGFGNTKGKVWTLYFD